MTARRGKDKPVPPLPFGGSAFSTLDNHTLVVPQPHHCPLLLWPSQKHTPWQWQWQVAYRPSPSFNAPVNGGG